MTNGDPADHLRPPGSGQGHAGVAPGCPLRRPAHLDRRHAARRRPDGTEFGRKAKEFMDAGQLLPDDVMLGIIEERFAEADAVDGWLLDGFPRTPRTGRRPPAPGRRPRHRPGHQPRGPRGRGGRAHLVPPGLPRLRHQLLGDRRVGVDGASAPSAAVRVVQRDDDTEEAVRKRLATYNEQTAPAARAGSRTRACSRPSTASGIPTRSSSGSSRWSRPASPHPEPPASRASAGSCVG